MDTLRETATGTAVAVENRGQARRQPSPMAYIEIGVGNGGLLLNLSEGGLAIQAAHVLREPKVQLRFRLPDFAKEIEAIGEVVWLAASDKRAGLRFVELSSAAQAAIRGWVAGVASVGGVSWEDRFGPRVRAGIERTVIPEIPSAKAAAEVESAATLFEQARRLILSRTAELSGEGSSPKTAVPENPSRSVNRGAGQAGTPSGQKKWSDRSVHPNPRATRSAFSSEPVVQNGPGIQNVQQTEVKLPEIAWWVEPQPTQKGSWSFIGWIFALAVIGAFAAGVLGFWQPEALLQRIGWNGTPAAAPAAPSASNLPTINPQQSETPPSENAPAGSGEAKATPSGADGQAVIQDDVAADESGESTGNIGKPESAPRVPARGAETGPPADPKVGSHGPASAGRHYGSSSRTAKAARSDSAPTSPHTGIQQEPDANTMLVRAPEPGSLPVLLSLPERTIGATAIAAVSSRRGIRIPPAISREGALQPERVTVGRLLASGIDFRLTGSDAQNAGVVEVLARIGLGGEVEQVKALNGPPRLAAMVQQQVRQWRYEPTFVNGRPVESEDDLRVVFRTR